MALGAAGTLVAVRLLASLLHGAASADPATLAAVGLLLAAVGLAACLVPARRAMRVDPAIALKCE
jgi:putative ABC transport system permease protein